MKLRLVTLVLAVVATLGILFVDTAPAAVEEAHVPPIARRPLPLEWNGVRPDPDLDRMFRKGAPPRPSLDDMFRRRR